MAKLVLTVCDVCKEPNQPTSKFRLGTTTTLNRMELCGPCTKRPLADLLKLLRPAARQKVTTEDQVAAHRKASKDLEQDLTASQARRA